MQTNGEDPTMSMLAECIHWPNDSAHIPKSIAAKDTMLGIFREPFFPGCAHMTGIKRWTKTVHGARSANIVSPMWCGFPGSCRMLMHYAFDSVGPMGTCACGGVTKSVCGSTAVTYMQCGPGQLVEPKAIVSCLRRGHVSESQSRNPVAAEPFCTMRQ